LERTVGNQSVKMTFLFVATVLCVVLAGCYTLEPAGTLVPVVGTGVAFDVNDVGRVALGGSMGPEIAQIEGNLLQRDSAEYVVGVTAVHLLRGGEQRWGGEPVHIKNEYVTSVYQRTFSRGRTIALASVAVGAVVWMARRSLFPGGYPDDSGPIDTGTVITRRVPVRPRGIRRSLVPLRPTPLLLPHLSRP
jgi:hypothetical protein